MTKEGLKEMIKGLLRLKEMMKKGLKEMIKGLLRLKEMIKRVVEIERDDKLKEMIKRVVEIEPTKLHLVLTHSIHLLLENDFSKRAYPVRVVVSSQVLLANTTSMKAELHFEKCNDGQ